jgi:D-alanyl-D-alanine carboxypeptidase
VSTALQRLGLCLVWVIALVIGGTAAAPALDVHAYLVADLGDGTVLEAHAPDRRLRPASLAKLMTLHLVFAALDAGTAKVSTRVLVSATAAAQDPVRLGLVAGESVSLETLIEATAIYSANDAAVALAEHVGESHTKFVGLMNARARSLGLRNTRFANAHGLPADTAYTSARDMALLARDIVLNQSHHATVFARGSFVFRERQWPGHNAWLTAVPGADGLKTGFTCRAGYHLAATRTHGGRHLLGIVLGAPNLSSRLGSMTKLMRRTQAVAGTEALAASARGALGPAVPTRVRAAACRGGARGVKARQGPSGFSIALAVYPSKREALAASSRFIKRFGRSGRALLTPRLTSGIAYQAGITGLDQKQATAMCLKARKRVQHCVVLTPKVAEMLWRRAVRSVAMVGRIKTLMTR